MTKESLLENLSIYHDNLSVYYLGSVFITIISVILAWTYHRFHTKSEPHNLKRADFESTEQEECDESDQDRKNADHKEIISKLKIGRQSMLVEKIAATLTEDQLRKEKEVEKQQLEAIFELLQSQEDNFQVDSLQELQDQLKLYRY